MAGALVTELTTPLGVVGVDPFDRPPTVTLDCALICFFSLLSTLRLAGFLILVFKFNSGIPFCIALNICGVIFSTP